MIARDPYILAEDLLAVMEWQGGVRMFDEAMRLCGGTGGRGSLETQVGGMRDLGAVEERASRALVHWGRLLDVATVARANGQEWSSELAEREKRNVSSDLPSVDVTLLTETWLSRRATHTLATTPPWPISTPSTPSPPPPLSIHRTPFTGPTPQQRGSRLAEWCSELKPPSLLERLG